MAAKRESHLTARVEQILIAGSPGRANAGAPPLHAIYPVPFERAKPACTFYQAKGIRSIDRELIP